VNDPSRGLVYIETIQQANEGGEDTVNMDGIPSMEFRTKSEDEEKAENKSPQFLESSLAQGSPNILELFSSSFPEEMCGSSSSVVGEESAGDQRVLPLGGDVVLPLGGDVLRKRLAKPLDGDLRVIGQVASIEQVGTFTTGEPENDDLDQSSSELPVSKREITSADKTMQEIYKEDDDTGGSNSLPALGFACTQTKFLYWMYISAGAVIGGTLRVYLSRLFGEDCELGKSAVQDSLTPFFSKICITAGGRTIQTGGALFRDWPANLLGCFFMGILTSEQHSSPFPWFHKDHPLQGNKFLLAGFGVGLCGCMTTFASWNSQMVIMMVR
jgi:fluoride ion exporter CrcB/FEX